MAKWLLNISFVDQWVYSPLCIHVSLSPFDEDSDDIFLESEEEEDNEDDDDMDIDSDVEVSNSECSSGPSSPSPSNTIKKPMMRRTELTYTNVFVA